MTIAGQSVGVAIANALGCPGAQTSAVALRGIDARRSPDFASNLSLAPSFIVGDAVLPIPLLDAFQKGRAHAVPLIIGSNCDDASVIEAFSVDPAVLSQKMGCSRIFIRSLCPGVFNEG